MKTLGDRLKKAMREAGVTSQAELSRQANLRPNTITRWIHGTTESPRPNDVGAVCRILGVRPEWLLLGSDPMREEGAREPDTPYRDDSLDVLLLGQCFTVMAEALGQRPTPLPPTAKIGAVIAEVYAMCLRERKQPTPELVAPFIRVLLA